VAGAAPTRSRARGVRFLGPSRGPSLLPVFDPLLVEAYWRHHRLASGSRQDRLDSHDWRWAVSEVQRAVEDDARPLELLDALLAHEEADPAYLGAGPIEDLVTAAPSRWAHELVSLAEHSSAWRQALGSVWLDREALVDAGELRRFLTG
jgi:hypothetical protein